MGDSLLHILIKSESASFCFCSEKNNNNKIKGDSASLRAVYPMQVSIIEHI